MRILAITTLFLVLIPGLGNADQILVFPAVTDEVPGEHDSIWVTVARIVKKNPRDAVAVRRLWVCLPDGGFAEDPDTAQQWTMGEGRGGRINFMWGNALLHNTGSTRGAVAYEIIGGEVLAQSTVLDVSNGVHQEKVFAFGQGQFIKPLSEPLTGPSHIPWLGGCSNGPCSDETPIHWDYLRNNIGIVNPNPEPLTIEFTVIPFYSIGFAFEVRDDDPEKFEKTIPPYGWLQFNWQATHYYGVTSVHQPIYPYAGFIISLTPDKETPYYAYASVVFAPDPENNTNTFNDPMFVPAEPGYVAPYAEVFPP